MKTFSVAIKDKRGDWITNWGQYFSLEEINWGEVKEFCNRRGCKAYGYYYGNNSRNLTSTKCRTVLEELEQ